jgi:hypothetical protein
VILSFFFTGFFIFSGLLGRFLGSFLIKGESWVQILLRDLKGSQETSPTYHGTLKKLLKISKNNQSSLVILTFFHSFL